MRTIKIFLYMLVFHPVLFFKYTASKKGRAFLVNGNARMISTKGLKLGKNVRFGDDTRIQFYGNSKMIIENRCYFGNRCTFLVGEEIKIDDTVLMASDVVVTSENHSIDPEANLPYGLQKLITKKVHICRGCWIGEKVIILPGVEIGEKSIIGAGSIVTKNIPSYSIAVGNPANVIKKYNFETHEWEKVKDI